MKKRALIVLLTLNSLLCFGQGIDNYQSLDPKQPIVFGGSYIVYQKDTINLGPRSFFIDGRLPDAVTDKHPYVFNSVQKAVAKLSNGSEDLPMALHIAPYVYWIDNPDDTAIRVGENGQPPYGMVIQCDWLKFHGLSANPRNVVLACNRGQTIGARGNFTMFRFIGQGTGSENITFGNYCNIDLDYPLLPTLNRKKRASAIVQAQLIHCNGDKIVARNTRFVSRLNLCPFVGGKRVLFDSCHFESTDDALCGTGVYLNCTLDVYASKPFYQTTGTGAVFLNCDITSYVKDEQYFTKANGQLAVIDTRFKTAANTYLGWREVVPPETRNYQFGVKQNGKPVYISKRDSLTTVDLANQTLLNAYRFTSNGKPVYNTYNLLRGNDDWDPMNIKNIVQATAGANHINLTEIPVQLIIAPTRVTIETGKSDVTLTAKSLRFGNYEAVPEKINWRAAPGYESLVNLQPTEDGSTCKVIPVNKTDDVNEVVIIASTDAGLQAASVLTVTPPILSAPGFNVEPKIVLASGGKLHLDYTLNTKYKDQSLVSWYRCSDATGKDAIEVAVSRLNEPFADYTLSAGDEGYFMMAVIQPRHSRSDTGHAVPVLYQSKITAADIKTNRHELVTNFKNLSTRNQSRVIPGFWTWAHLQSLESDRRFTNDTTKDAWHYGEGTEGATGISGVLQGRNGRMFYTPVKGTYNDIQMTIAAAPFKTAGQGFSVAPLFMDVLIKMDTRTMTGYGLRLIRTTKYSDAIDVYFVRYDHGEVKPISEAVTTTVFRTMCTIQVAAKGNELSATLRTNAGAHSADGKPGILSSVNIKTNIEPNNFGGLGIEFRGGSPVLFSELKVGWK